MKNTYIPRDRIAIQLPLTYPSSPDRNEVFIDGKRLTKNTATIEDVPFDTAMVAKGDVVAITSEQKFIKVLASGSYTRLLMVPAIVALFASEATDRDVMEAIELVVHDLTGLGIEVRPSYDGYFAISVPRWLSDRQLEETADRIGAHVIHHEDEHMQ